MNPIYQFKLSINGGTQQVVHPSYSSLEKEWQKESNFAFFRVSLTGKLTFQGSEYTLITNRSINDKFELELLISYDNSSTWNNYWNGEFYLTDCEINEDEMTVTVQPRTIDNYKAIVDALDKEIDLIPAAPRLVPLKYHKRPVVQFYIAGQSVVGNYMDGIYWEQSSNVESNLTTLNNTYKFGLLKECLRVPATGAINDFFWGIDISGNYSIDSVSGTYTLTKEIQGQWANYFITYKNQSTKLYGASSYTPLGTLVLQAMSGSGMTGEVTIDRQEYNLCARMICDVTEYKGISTMSLPTNDLVETTYHYALALNKESYGSIAQFNYLFDSEPTQWGMFKSDQYYLRPNDSYIPMVRNSWEEISIWLYPYNLQVASPNMFEEGAKEIINTDCYPIDSVLDVMLQKLGLSLTFKPTLLYSQFLYGDTTMPDNVKIKKVDYRLYITPKSNVLKGQYDQAAQKAIITLRDIFSMFEKCLRCYWFVDGNRLRIEHIWWFMNGGSYAGTPIVDRDLTTEKMMRNRKQLDYAQNVYSYDKPETVGQYQFGWMDDVTIPFKGEPIKIVSPYVNQQTVENIDVAKFTSDVDYMNVSPAECSNDGFAIFACLAEEEDVEIEFVQPTELANPLNIGDVITSFGTARTVRLYPVDTQLPTISVHRDELPYTVATPIGKIQITNPIGDATLTLNYFSHPYVPFVPKTDTEYKLQNGYLSFWYLQRYYDYDMPAYQYKIGDATESQTAKYVKRIKTQDVSFFALNDIDTKKLIKTNIGNGQIEKININLSDRNARVTLKFD